MMMTNADSHPEKARGIDSLSEWEAMFSFGSYRVWKLRNADPTPIPKELSKNLRREAREKRAAKEKQALKEKEARKMKIEATKGQRLVMPAQGHLRKRKRDMNALFLNT
jgi:hypothetical protein